MASEADLRRAFANVSDVVVDGSFVRAAEALCGEHELSAGDLAAQWEALALNFPQLGQSALLKKLSEQVAREAKLAREQGGSALKRRKVALGPSNNVVQQQQQQQQQQPQFGTPVMTTRTIKHLPGHGRRVDAFSPGVVSGGAASPLSSASPLGGASPMAQLDSPVSATGGKGGAVAGAGYTERTDMGKVELVLHDEVVASGAAKAGGAAVDVELVGCAAPFKYMYSTLEQRAEELDADLEARKQRFMAKHGWSEGDLSAVGTASQESVLVCGRLWCEAPVGKLNSKSLLLEGGRSDSGGARVRLDVDKALSSYSLYPGQVLCVRGSCPTGDVLYATELFCSLAPPSARAPARTGVVFPAPAAAAGEGADAWSPSAAGAAGAAAAGGGAAVAAAARTAAAAAAAGGAAVEAATAPAATATAPTPAPAQEEEDVDLMVACGPFSLAGDLEYEPLEDLLAHVAADKPAVLVLMGPFVDADHPAIASGQCAKAVPGAKAPQSFFFEDLLEYVLSRIAASVDGTRTRVVLVPCTNDVAGASICFPQPPLSTTRERLRELGFSRPEQLVLASNPATLDVGPALRLGICTADVLMDLARDDTVLVDREAPKKERLVRLAEHLVDSASYYPLFPAGPDTPLEPLMQPAAEMRGPKPDLVLLSSKLKHFAYDVQGSLMVNPGRLARGKAGGTFARILVKGRSREAREQVQRAQSLQGQHADNIPNNVSERTRVEVVRI
jgi:hypothetical protein